MQGFSLQIKCKQEPIENYVIYHGNTMTILPIFCVQKPYYTCIFGIILKVFIIKPWHKISHA